ncbi:MAG: N-acetylmuramoyl-L-alanine amidase [bacterium]
MTGRRGRGVLLAGALLLAALGPAGALAASEPDKLDGSVVTPERSGARHLDVYRTGGVDYVDVNEVARIFRGTKFWRAEIEKLVLRFGDRRLKLTVGSPYVYVDEQGTNLYAPVRWIDGRIFVPMSFVTDVVDPIVPEAVAWDAVSLRLRVDSSDPNIRAIEVSARQNGVVAELRLADPLAATISVEGTRAELRIPGGVFVPGTRAAGSGGTLVRNVTTRQDGGEAVVTFELAVEDVSAETMSRTSPPRILVTFREPGGELPLPGYEGVAPSMAPRVVVVDAGHGGSDAGVSAGGALEKDVTLAMSREIARRLRDAGFTVVLTRDGDRFLSGDDRATRANTASADLFLSVHANAWFDDAMTGFSIGLPRSAGGGTGDGTFRAWGERAARTTGDEDLCAELVAESLETRLALPNRGTRRAEFAPLAGTGCAAMLLECGFLTNPVDAARLTSPDQQAAFAEAVARAIAAWRDQLEAGGTP